MFGIFAGLCNLAFTLYNVWAVFEHDVYTGARSGLNWPDRSDVQSLKAQFAGRVVLYKMGNGYTYAFDSDAELLGKIVPMTVLYSNGRAWVSFPSRYVDDNWSVFRRNLSDSFMVVNQTGADVK